MSSVFGTGRSANSVYYGLALRKQHNLQKTVFYEYEDRFVKIAKISSFSEWIVDLHESIARKLAKQNAQYEVRVNALRASSLILSLIFDSLFVLRYRLCVHQK